MGKYRREALIEKLDGDVGHLLAPLRNKLLDTRQVLARLTVHLAWFAYDNALNRLAALCSRSEQAECDLRAKLAAWAIAPNDADRITERIVRQVEAGQL